MLDYLGIFLASYLQYVLCAFLLALLVYPKAKRNMNLHMVLAATISLIIARIGIKTIILLFYSRPRPFMVLNWVHPLISTSVSENFQSFPSGHALFFFALAAAVYGFNKKLGAWYFAAAILMSLARIYTGVHWPSDILAGAVLGTAAGWAITYFYKKIIMKA